MSHLADEIARQMQAANLSQSDVADRSKISQSQVSKWLASDQTSITEAHLSALGPALSEAAADHAALVRAHLLDEKYGPGADLVTVEILSEAALRNRPKLRSKGEKALQFLSQERHTNRELNELLIDLARVLGATL